MTTRLDHYPPCIYTDCSSRTLEQDCYGVLGCSWCDKTQDGYGNISSPLCSDQRECYGGILGSQSPYSRIFDRSLVHSVEDEERSLSRAGPIGPVAGGIMAFFLLLALAVWGYKHWSAGGSPLVIQVKPIKMWNKKTTCIWCWFKANIFTSKLKIN